MELCDRLHNSLPTPTCPHSNPWPSKYVTFHGKSNFANVLRTLRWFIILDYTDRLSVIIKVLISNMWESENGCEGRSENWSMWFAERQKDHEPRNAGGLGKYVYRYMHVHIHIYVICWCSYLYILAVQILYFNPLILKTSNTKLQRI